MIDGRPQELLVLTLDGLALEQHSGRSAGLLFNHSRARVRSLQVRARVEGLAAAGSRVEE